MEVVVEQIKWPIGGQNLKVIQSGQNPPKWSKIQSATIEPKLKMALSGLRCIMDKIFKVAQNGPES